MDQNTTQIHKGGSLRICGKHNVRAFIKDNTGQNTKNTHLVPGLRIKSLAPWKLNKLRAPGVKIMGSTDHATMSDVC